jgi:guanylate kinase
MSKLFIIGGASGSGKTTIMKALKSIWLKEIIPMTSRKPRKNEKEGTDYYFVSKNEILRLKRNGELALYLEFIRTCYGVSKKEIEDKLKNSHAFLITSYQGMQQIKEHYTNSTSIFIDISYQDLIFNLLEREDNNIEMVKRRITTYDRERKHINHYDNVVTNVRGKLENAIMNVKDIIEREIKL